MKTKYMQNTQHTSSEENLGREFNKQVDKLLGLKKGEFAKQVEEKGEKTAILDLLKDNQENENFAIFLLENKDWKYIEQLDVSNRTKAVIKASLSKNIGALKFVSEEMKTDINIARSIVTAYIKDGKNFLDVERYLETYFEGSKDYERLVSHYLKTQKLHGVLSRNDLTSYLIDIKNTQFYKHLKSQKSITGVGNYIKPSTSLIRSFLNNTNSENIDLITDEKEKKSIFLKIFIGVINSHPDSLSDEEKLVFDKMLEICISEYNKKFLPDKKQKKNQEKEKKQSYTDEFETQEDFQDYTPKEKLDYCYPTRGYIISDSGNYSVDLGEGKYLDISKNEMKQASVKALENYAIFYEALCSAKLEFLWKKYKNPFCVACSNAFGFDYLSGEGVTASKLLQVLNFVARNIGFPEHEYIDSKGEEQSEVRCFDDTKSAIDSFKYIQKSGKINDKIIDPNPNSSERRVVEQYLIQMGLLDGKGGFNTLSWE